MRVPIATYRLQFGPDLGFAEARELVSYLRRIGITDLYASPIFRASSKSTHGYDITDPLQLNPKLGKEQEFDLLVDELKHHKMGLLLDIVPNHMAASAENPWWADVLENGEQSPYAPYFDIDWTSDSEGKLVLPILGKPYEEVLADGEMTVEVGEQGLRLRYYDSTFPVATESYASVLEHRLESMSQTSGAATAGFETLVSLVEQSKANRGEADDVGRRLFELYTSDQAVHSFIDESLAAYAGTTSKRRDVRAMRSLLDQQPYRLAYWRSGTEEINYRRFFDISGLVCVRVEDEAVFDATHALILRLARERKVTGLRIDHIDGLYDPAAYLRRLQSRFRSPKSDVDGTTYVLVEKILSGEETLPDGWPVSGTTGYDALNTINGLFVDQGGLAKLEAAYKRFTGIETKRADVSYEQKRQMARELFQGELTRLQEHVRSLAERDPHAPDLRDEELAEALASVSASLPVYRTYIDGFTVGSSDRGYIEHALAEARRRNPTIDEVPFSFLRRVLLLESPPAVAEAREARLAFVMRWQQFTGPLAAKGIEDTAHYAYNPLVSLNEVGADPEALAAVDIATFHRRNEVKLRDWPHTLNASATHDTKRGEDVRARINVLSEVADEWLSCLSRWSELNRDKKQLVGGALAPDANAEALLYQTLVGAWPLEEDELPGFRERIKAYALKAAREAKVRTSWLDPQAEYEEGLTGFVEAVLTPGQQNSFLPEVRRFARKIAFYGATNSLAQLLLKIASPGVPDFYQGTELWDLNLVDPDNRRAVDFRSRTRLLDELEHRAADDLVRLVQELLGAWQDGRIKLYLTAKALAFRRDNPELFGTGDYVPVGASGPWSEHVVAFARRSGSSWALAAVPRLVTVLSPEGTPPVGREVWGDTAVSLPRDAPRSWRNALTGESLESEGELPVGSVFGHHPVALLSGGSQ